MPKSSGFASPINYGRIISIKKRFHRLLIEIGSEVHGLQQRGLLGVTILRVGVALKILFTLAELMLRL